MQNFLPEKLEPYSIIYWALFLILNVISSDFWLPTTIIVISCIDAVKLAFGHGRTVCNSTTSHSSILEIKA